MAAYTVTLFVVFTFFLGSISSDPQARVIRGSAMEVFCPYGRATKEFQLPSGKVQVLDNGASHLRIPEVGAEHNGEFLCSDGRKRIVAKRIAVIEDPGTYKAELRDPHFVFGGPFRLECLLRIFEPGTKAHVRFLVDGKRFADEDFTDFRVSSRDPLELLFWLNRDLPVTASDVGRTVQCEVVVPAAGPCCPRSRKVQIKVEKPLKFVQKTWRDRTLISGEVLTLVFDVSHYNPFHGSDVAVLNANGSRVPLIAAPNVSTVNAHLSTVTVRFTPLTAGIYRIALGPQLAVQTVPFHVGLLHAANHVATSSAAIAGGVTVVVFLIVVVIVLAVLRRKPKSQPDANGSEAESSQHHLMEQVSGDIFCQKDSP